MNAVVWNGERLPEVTAVPRPEPASNEVLLRIERAGVCGTDLSILAGAHPRARAPLILGHELAGRVVEVGNDVPDDRRRVLGTGLATVEPIISCGTCVACRNGTPHVCQNLRLYGIDLPGGMAEFLAVREDLVIPAPQELEADDVVLAEPLAVAVHAVRRAGQRYGDRVCVIGGGPIGLMIGIVAREAGARTVVVSEPMANRRAIAGSLGFTTLDPTSTDLTQTVMDVTGGDGVDVCYESAGSKAAVLAATQVLRPRGTLTQVSIPKVPVPVRLVDIAFRELTVVGVRVYEPGDFDKALQLLCLRTRELALLRSKPYGLADSKAAFGDAIAGSNALRVIIDTTSNG